MWTRYERICTMYIVHMRWKKNNGNTKTKWKYILYINQDSNRTRVHLSLNDKVKKGAEFGMESKRKIKQILFDVCHHHFRCVRCIFHISQLFTSMHNSTCYRIMDTADKQTNKNQIPSFSIKHYLPMMTCTDHSPVFFFFFSLSLSFDLTIPLLIEMVTFKMEFSSQFHPNRIEKKMHSMNDMRWKDNRYTFLFEQLNIMIWTRHRSMVVTFVTSSFILFLFTYYKLHCQLIWIHPKGI